MKHNHTKERIAQALKNLSKTKDLAKISIQDIISESDINRGTFYYHFIDKDDLIKWIFKHDVVDHFLEAKEREWTYNTYHLLCILKQDNAFYRQALKINSVNNFRKHLFEVNCHAAVTLINNSPNGGALPDAQKSFIADFFAHALTETYIQYVLRGAKETPEKMLQYYYDLCEPQIFMAIDRFIEHQHEFGMYPLTLMSKV